MNKYFVVSDVHGFYDELIEALANAGYDSENEQHYLIGCGDFFDRGPKPLEVMKFFMNAPRAILIRGNHEDLFEDACNYGMGMHDIHNGTDKTIWKLANLKKDLRDFYEDPQESFNTAMARTQAFRDRLVDFYETKHYVFVHGWIPTEYYNNWKKGNWREARWKNGLKEAFEGNTLDDKTIVCGHWHTSWIRHFLNPEIAEWGETADFSPYYGDGIIAIDGCTAYTGKVNCIVLTDEEENNE